MNFFIIQLVLYFTVMSSEVKLLSLEQNFVVLLSSKLTLLSQDYSYKNWQVSSREVLLLKFFVFVIFKSIL